MGAVNPAALTHAPRGLATDREFVLAALAWNKDVLQHAPEEVLPREQP